ncbi:MAG: TIR domain-containing protein, partial [Acidobacteriota bacterium]
MRTNDFEGDAFISYAHLDNVGLVEGRKGWVANLHRALEVRVAQLLGKESHIWWDAKLQGNDVFALTLVDQLKRVAALIAVISPRYVRSEWGRKELEEFCKAAQEQGGLRVHDKARIFKVLKTPVPLEEQPEELQSLLGYEFFKVDSSSGKVRELDEVFGPEAQREFWLKLDDLANDLCLLIKMLEPEPAPGTPVVPDKGTVYVAVT